mmetsp:Transcript_83056/g.185481  ORF Transcript_83056/g.185481 Transcript_83056/m.185481 type:complete len:242 (+) Transcript_83056:106-831(+)
MALHTVSKRQQQAHEASESCALQALLGHHNGRRCCCQPLWNGPGGPLHHEAPPFQHALDLPRVDLRHRRHHPLGQGGLTRTAPGLQHPQSLQNGVLRSVHAGGDSVAKLVLCRLYRSLVDPAVLVPERLLRHDLHLILARRAHEEPLFGSATTSRWCHGLALGCRSCIYGLHCHQELPVRKLCQHLRGKVGCFAERHCSLEANEAAHRTAAGRRPRIVSLPAAAVAAATATTRRVGRRGNR